MQWWIGVLIGVGIVVIEELIAAPKRKACSEAMRREAERLNIRVDEADKKHPSR